MPSKVTLGLVIANVFGIAAYLYMSSRYTWAIPQEREGGVYAVTGEPFIWAAIVMPIFSTFGLINLIWGVSIIVKKRWRRAFPWLAVVCIWLVAVVIDLAHH